MSASGHFCVRQWAVLIGRERALSCPPMGSFSCPPTAGHYGCPPPPPQREPLGGEPARLLPLRRLPTPRESSRTAHTTQWRPTLFDSDELLQLSPRPGHGSNTRNSPVMSRTSGSTRSANSTVISPSSAESEPRQQHCNDRVHSDFSLPCHRRRVDAVLRRHLRARHRYRKLGIARCGRGRRVRITLRSQYFGGHGG